MSTTPTDSADAPPLPPPDPVDHERPSTPSVVLGRPGDLTPTWRMLLASAWVLAFFAYAAIWNASVQIGIGTWWVGPRAQPTFILVKLLPFLLCLTVLVCVVSQVAKPVRISAAATGLAALGAIPDFSRTVGLGIAELTVAGLLGVVTLTALTGTYKLAPGRPAGSSLPPPPH